MTLPVIFNNSVTGFKAAASYLARPFKSRRTKSKEAFDFYSDASISPNDKWEKLAKDFPLVARAFKDLKSLCPHLMPAIAVGKTFSMGSLKVCFALCPTSEAQYQSDPRMAASLESAGLNGLWRAGLLKADLMLDDKLGIRFCSAGYGAGGLGILDGKKAHELYVADLLFKQAVRDGMLQRLNPDAGNIDPANYVPLVIDDVSSRSDRIGSPPVARLVCQ